DHLDRANSLGTLAAHQNLDGSRLLARALAVAAVMAAGFAFLNLRVVVVRLEVDQQVGLEVVRPASRVDDAGGGFADRRRLRSGFRNDIKGAGGEVGSGG